MPYRLQIALVFWRPCSSSWALLARRRAWRPGAVARAQLCDPRTLPDPDQAVGLPPVDGPIVRGDRLVVIDAGHGGHDPGASGTGVLDLVREKTLALGLARVLRDELLRTGHPRCFDPQR